MLKDDWAAALIVLVIWLVVSLIRPRQSVGPFDTFIAAIILSTLWFFVFVLRAHPSPQFMGDHGSLLFGLSAGLGYLFSLGMLHLDKLTYGQLIRVDDEMIPRRP